MVGGPRLADRRRGARTSAAATFVVASMVVAAASGALVGRSGGERDHVREHAVDDEVLLLVGEVGEQRQHQDLGRRGVGVRQVRGDVRVGALVVDRHHAAARRDAVVQQAAHELGALHRRAGPDAHGVGLPGALARTRARTASRGTGWPANAAL